MALFQGPVLSDRNKIRPKELIQLLKKKANVVIIDLRDPNTDYQGGNIRNSISIPYGEFIKSISIYVDKYCDVDTIVFHCMYSKVRGPKACHQYLQCIDENEKNDSNGNLKNQNVYLLIGGFRKWMDLNYATNDELIENLELKCWKHDKHSQRWTHKHDW